MSTAIENLLAILDLEPLELNLFRGRSPQVTWQRVFGGQVVGQALVAAQRTVEAARSIHSLHGYFIRPGDPAVDSHTKCDTELPGNRFRFFHHLDTEFARGRIGHQLHQRRSRQGTDRIVSYITDQLYPHVVPDVRADRTAETGRDESVGDLPAALALSSIRLAQREPGAFDVPDHPRRDDGGRRIDYATDHPLGMYALHDDPARIDTLERSAFPFAAVPVEVPVLDGHDRVLHVRRDIGRGNDGPVHLRVQGGDDAAVRVEGPIALEIQHLSPVILERVNRFLGWQALGRVRLRQAPLRRGSTSMSQQRLDPESIAHVAAGLSDIADPKLRDALARLGAAIKQS